MHRREFLKFQAAAALSIDPAALGFPTRLLADASPDIAVVKGSPAAATRAAVELLGGMSVASYEWYGRRIQPRQVAHIAQAHARGLGRMDIENMHVQRLSL